MAGIIVSSGIAMGKVKRIEAYGPVGLEKTQDIDQALLTLEKSLTTMDHKLINLQEKTKKLLGEKEAQIFEAHRMIIKDPTLMPQIIDIIKKEHLSPGAAVEKVLTDMELMFKHLDSDYMKERALDIFDIKKRWVSLLRGNDSFENLSEPVILIAEELTPSDTLEMDLELVSGLVMEKGGKTSHTAILAQSMGIPAIVGYGPISLESGVDVILDGDQGLLIDDYDQETLSDYQKKLDLYLSEKEMLKKYLARPSQTLDGKYIELAGNIAGIQDLEALKTYHADGVGLFRTEFIYMNRSKAPTEDDQYDIYKKIVLAMDQKPIIFRSMDIGGDKEVPYLDMPKEHNPFLGYRAIRYCLDHVDFFKAQINAILRASVYGKVKLMFPMIGSVSQFIEAKKVVLKCMEDLKSKGQAFDASMEIGIMIEIPSAAIQVKAFAKHVDFFSIGTNDLTQYTLATDRQSEYVSGLYDYFDPAVLSLIHQVIKVSNETNTWVGMCGSAAGDPLMIPLLIKWGIDEMSMSPSQIPKAKSILCEMDTREDKNLTLEILSAEDGTMVRKILENYK